MGEVKMPKTVILVSIAHLREQDLSRLPNLLKVCQKGQTVTLKPTFPCVTCPVQANMTTGKLPNKHGIVGNGLYYRDRHFLEMWTGDNSVIETHQIWDVLEHSQQEIESAVWMPLHSKFCEANYVCTPAPIHNPDGSETLWCWSRPTSLYGKLRDKYGDFPLMNWWGPMSNIVSDTWSVDSAIYLAQKRQPSFFYIYLPHTDYESQKFGPDSPQMMASLDKYNDLIGKLVDEMTAVYGEENLVWLFAGEYSIVPVDHVTYPNRILRDAGLLKTISESSVPNPHVHHVPGMPQKELTGKEELIDFANTPAFAAADHQFSHVYLQDRSPENVTKVAQLFEGKEGFDDVVYGDRLTDFGLNHERTGDLVLVSAPNSWQAYYYWFDDANAPSFAHTVDIHRKPGYDPCELFFDPVIRGIPTDASLIKGSHGAPAREDNQKTVLAASENVTSETELADVDVYEIVMKAYGFDSY